MEQSTHVMPAPTHQAVRNELVELYSPSPVGRPVYVAYYFDSDKEFRRSFDRSGLVGSLVGRMMEQDSSKISITFSEDRTTIYVLSDMLSVESYIIKREPV